jgi:tetratricopeptide (TPR) repeat protein
MKGTMLDIFDIQEKVATNVVDGLNIILTKEEKSKLDERGTENAEAYEYAMRADELCQTFTREGLLQAISLLDLAIKLDPQYVAALTKKAQTIGILLKGYERDPTLFKEVELLLQRVEELKPGLWDVHDTLAQLYLVAGRTEDAEREHQEHIAKDDGSAVSQGNLGYFCFATKQYSKAFEYYETSLKIDSTNKLWLWNAIINAQLSGNIEGLNRWSDLAISSFQKRLRLHPEESIWRYALASTFFWSNPPRLAESLQEINLLESLPDLDSMIQYQIAKLLAEQREDDHAIESLRKAIGKGFADIGKIRDADSAFAPLFGTPAFEAVMKGIV